MPCPKPPRAQPARDTKKVAADVIAVSSDEGQELDATKIFAKGLHGKATEVHVVQSVDALVSYLADFESIRSLVFLFHGGPGEMKVGVNVVELTEIVKKLKAAAALPACDELIFEGCHVGSGGAQIAAMMEALHAKKASGYATFHAWSTFTLNQGKGGSAELLEKDPTYRRFKRFIVADQPDAAVIVSHPGTYHLPFEFFTSTETEAAVLASGLPGQVERLRDRRQLNTKTFSLANAAQAKEFDTIPGSMTIVIFTR